MPPAPPGPLKTTKNQKFDKIWGPGGVTNRRGMKKYPGGVIFMNFGWTLKVLCQIWFNMDHSDVQIPRVLSNFHKSGIGAHNTPLKVGIGGSGFQS